LVAETTERETVIVRSCCSDSSVTGIDAMEHTSAAIMPRTLMNWML
jgi:hypothetical protein